MYAKSKELKKYFYKVIQWKCVQKLKLIKSEKKTRKHELIVLIILERNLQSMCEFYAVCNLDRVRFFLPVFTSNFRKSAIVRPNRLFA